MANFFAGDPIVLDTVWTAGTIPAALTALKDVQKFRRIVWVGGTAGDTILITDASSSTNTLFNDFCPVTNQAVLLWGESGGSESRYTFRQGLWVLTTMAHGKLLLYR